jgi:hypothetical protein
MSTKLLILFLIISTGGNHAVPKLTPPALLPDGLILKGLEGKLTSPDSNGGWFFETDSDITDKNAVAKAGTKLMLLPSATLEKMITDANERSISQYRLEARVTKYKGKNFLFPSYFVPISSPKTSQQTTPDKTAPAKNSTEYPNLNDTNDILTIPPDVLEKIEAARAKMAQSGHRISDSNRISPDKQKSVNKKRTPRTTDSVIIDRVAIFTEQQNGEFSFVLDAFGRNVPKVRFKLLPCKALELSELIQSVSLEPARFKIAGIVTKYKGNDYLLLQKATRIYSQGNFGI